MNGAAGEQGSFSVVVDAAHRVLESDAPRWTAMAVGDVLSPATALGEAALAVLGAASEAQPLSRVVREYTQGAHWIVRAQVVHDDPYRARILAVDATLAVLADRRAVLGSVVHTVRNATFALSSVLEALTLDRPTGAALDEYLSHLRAPAERLSATMARVAETEPRSPLLCPTSMDAVVRLGLAVVDPARRPAETTIRDAGMTVAGDLELLAEVLAAMLESAEVPAHLTVESIDQDGVPHAQLLVERRASRQEESAPGALWDLGDVHRLDSRLRLVAARAAVHAHGGRVIATLASPGRLRIGALLPRLTAG